MKTTIKSLVASLALLASAAAFATPVNLLGAENPDLQEVINGLYKSATCPSCSLVSQAPDVNLNQAAESGQFQINAGSGSVSTMIIEVAGFASTNTFGIYDINDTNVKLELFSGVVTTGGKKTLNVDEFFVFSLGDDNLSPTQFSSSAFGYYLSTATGPIFYSQASLNGGDDHMVAFKGDGDKIKLPTKPASVWGSESFILAWEDLPATSAAYDWDYQDMVIYVASVTAIPEPGSMALLGLGLAGLAASARRKQRA